MSMHEIPLTELERSGLYVHGLEIGKPSQLSDSFRSGVAWALLKDQERLSNNVEKRVNLNELCNRLHTGYFSTWFRCRCRGFHNQVTFAVLDISSGTGF